MDNPIELTYTGVAGWHLRTPGHALSFDPYYTRMNMVRGEIRPAIPDVEAIREHAPPTDSIFISHPHYDHIMDAPEVARLHGAAIHTSPQGCDLLRILGVPEEQIRPIQSGDRLALGDMAVTVYRAQHRIIFGKVPFQGALRPGLTPPIHGRDYRMVQLFSFLIEVGGMRILICNGIDAEPRVEADLLIVGPDAARWQLELILGDVKPRVVLPNHWDNMFQPLSAPVRPMVQSPRRFTLWPRRIDLGRFTQLVNEIAPAARVLVPERFKAYRVGKLLS
jgi:L-ascorbate metabolism protein UlaG (beta-lactamase superfamily)